MQIAEDWVRSDFLVLENDTELKKFVCCVIQISESYSNNNSKKENLLKKY